MYFIVHTDYPEDLGNALLRANAWYRRSIDTNTFRIESRNLDAPLTDDEKRRIRTYLESQDFSMKIIFDN